MKAMWRFSPLFLLYFFYILFFSQSETFGDEIRYVGYAENLLNGFYTTRDTPNLINGPGYPLYLAAFLALKLPLLVPKLFNAVLFFLAVFFFYRTLRFFVPAKQATFFAYALGLYWPIIICTRWNLTESLAIFLLCSFMYVMARLQRLEKNSLAYSLLAGIIIGYLALTRDIFSYVILAGLLLSVLYYLLFRDRRAARWAGVLSIGFLMVVPYLAYTYSVTGRYFYFSSNGGEQLYWMSTKHEHEFGSFILLDSVYERRRTTIHPGHVAFVDSIYAMPPVARNDVLMARAKENIMRNPKGYIKNVIANALRLISDGPESNRYQGWYTYKALFTNLLFLAPFLLSLYPAWVHRKSIPFELLSLCLFILIYLGGSVLVAAMVRYFALAVPFFLLWLAFFYTHLIQISFENKYIKKA